MNVKVCGITNEEDARMALMAGADVIGTIIDVPVETPRKVSLERAVAIKASVADINHALVAVLMPKSVDEVLAVHEALHPAGIQLHGNESPAFISEVAEAVDSYIIKAVHIGEGFVMEHAMALAEVSDMLLLDTISGGKTGGTGLTHDWEMDRKIKDATERRVILAGGLTPDNVVEAVKAVKPYAVDVSSGVESSPGRKDPDLVKRFIGVTACL